MQEATASTSLHSFVLLSQPCLTGSLKTGTATAVVRLVFSSTSGSTGIYGQVMTTQKSLRFVLRLLFLTAVQLRMNSHVHTGQQQSLNMLTHHIVQMLQVSILLSGKSSRVTRMSGALQTETHSTRLLRLYSQVSSVSLEVLLLTQVHSMTLRSRLLSVTLTHHISLSQHLKTASMMQYLYLFMNF